MQQTTRDARPAAQPNTSLVLTGSSDDPQHITMQLERAQKHAHLVSPATSVAVLPEGCAVVLSQVLVDVANETHSTGGSGAAEKFGLGKTALDRIAAAAGISWDPTLSGRTDDRSDPHYCSWRAVGTLRHLDGTEITIDGSKEMDLREAAAQVEALWARFDAEKAKWDAGIRTRNYPPKEPTAQIREMRLHIMAHAESKARLRAIRQGCGLRAGYTKAELAKPFVVARLMFTGHSDDPGIRRDFAHMTAAAMLGGRRALYGNPAPALAAPQPMARLAAPAAATPIRGNAPPPVSRSRVDEDDVDLETGEVLPARPARQAQAETRRESAEREPAQTREPERGALSGQTIPGGREKGTPVEEASDESLKYWGERIDAALSEGTSRFADKDQRLLDAILAEQNARGGQ